MKLDAWKAWCAAAGTESLASEFTLENSSHGKAFSYAWDAATKAEREVCARIAEEPYEFTSNESHRIAAAIRSRR